MLKLPLIESIGARVKGKKHPFLRLFTFVSYFTTPLNGKVYGKRSKLHVNENILRAVFEVRGRVKKKFDSLRL